MPEDITADTGKISNDLNHWLEEAQKKHAAIIAAKEQLSEGRNVGQIHREMGITELTYYRWRKEYDGMKTTQIKRLKDLCQCSWHHRPETSDLFRRGRCTSH